MFPKYRTHDLEVKNILVPSIGVDTIRHVLRSVEVGMLQEMYRTVLNSVWLEAVIMEKL